jgi:hypothetical protein
MSAPDPALRQLLDANICQRAVWIYVARERVEAHNGKGTFVHAAK